MMVYLSDKKKEKLKFLCTQVTGKIVSSLPGSEFGKLHYRNLECDKNRGDYDAKMQLSVLAKEDLLWLRMCNKPAENYSCSNHLCFSD